MATTEAKATVTLALIVKDAEGSVGRCITSVLPLVDRWLIIDTGSTDGTKDEILSAVGDLPGELLDRPWKNFAHNRTELLMEARSRSTGYTLMLDADMLVVIDADMPPLVADEYLVMLHDRDLLYALPLLTNNAMPFTYGGVAHACLNCSERTTTESIRSFHVVDLGGGPGRDDKFEKDREALEAQLFREPDDARSTFYLAQTYRDLDMNEEAIKTYLARAEMGGWREEIYNSLYQAGKICSEHRSFLEGSEYLFKAWQLCPNRAEALRALSNIATAVANKIPFPSDDVLFVEPDAYKFAVSGLLGAPAGVTKETLPSISSGKRRRPRYTKKRGLDPRDVSAIIPTRGDVDLQPVLDTIPFDDVVVWDNSKETVDLKPFGRFAAIPRTKNPVIFWVDDDVIFTEYDKLLLAYEPGVVVCNMDQDWIDGAGYGDFLAMTGAGSLCDADMPERIFDVYLQHYPVDDDFLVEADFIFGTLAEFKRVDLGYTARPFSDDATRLYTQPGQTERKHAMIKRCRDLLVELGLS